MGQSTILNKLVSSANSLILVFMFFTISFINIKNNVGPNIDPCGTPALMCIQDELVSL